MAPLPRPFRLGTTSFIYPGMILPNVERLGPVFDEIELLVFESRPYQGISVLPSEADVVELARLGKALDLSYNIHLPVDVSLTHPEYRAEAVETLVRVVELMAPLSPTAHALHLPMDEALENELRLHRGKETLPGDLASALETWLNHARRGLDALLPRLDDPGCLSVETLDYPPETLYPLLAEYPVNLCLDVGHHFKYGFDGGAVLSEYRDRIPLIHLHGVEPRGEKIQDHVGLDRLDAPTRADFLPRLADFTGTLSLEVFSLEHLNGSLSVLDQYFEGIPSQLGA